MNLRKILNILNPQLEIGGLKISDLHMRYVRIKRGKLITAFLKLTPGIIKEGKVKDREKFIAALKELHYQIGRNSKKKVSAVVTIPDDSIYIQVFNLPAMTISNIEEAAKLNLQMISPIDFNNAYSDWQLFGESATDGNQLEILGAFIQKDIINEYEHCLKESGFAVAAIECPALSLSRLAIEWGVNINFKDAYILLQVGTNGLGFNVVRQGNFCFNHFVSWGSVYGEKRETTFGDFKNILINETQRVLKFYETHWAGQINSLFLVSPRLHQEIFQIISKEFSLQVQLLALKKFKELEPVWFSALGSALRGLISRAKDTIISLASTGTEKEFFQQRVINFIKIWRNIFFASLVLLLIIFLGVDIFLINTVRSMNYQLAFSAKQPEIAELNKLKEEARIFNQKVGFALDAKREIFYWSPFLEKIKDLSASGDIVIDRIFIQSLEAPASIRARAKTEESAINFRKVLSEQPQFQDVNLPLSSFVAAADGVSFIINFKIKNGGKF